MNYKSLLVIVVLLVQNSFSDEYFIELSQGLSYGDISSKSRTYEKSFETTNSFNVPVTTFDARFGYSFLLRKGLLLEPSFGLGYLKSLTQDVRIEPSYSLEVPLMYKHNSLKFGLYAKYNYFPTISSEASYSKVKFQNKDSISYGAKMILCGKVVDFIVKYEYMTNAMYEETFNMVDDNNNFKVDSKLDLNGGYLSAGLRFKF